MLVRQITADTLDGKTTSPAMNILKKHFSTNTELGKELQLYQVFFNSRKLNETRAMQLLNMVLDQRKKLDERKLEREKYTLISELKQNYDLRSFLSCKVPSYKLYASIYKTFITEAKHQDDTILNIQDVASARFTLIEHLLGNNHKVALKESPSITEFKQQPEDVRRLTYKILVDKFNEKYAHLNENQRLLLQKYIHDTTNGERLAEYVMSVIPSLQATLKTKMKKLTDKVMEIKLTEVIAQLDAMKGLKVIKENHYTALMLAYAIDGELK